MTLKALLVENEPRQFESLSNELKTADWQVERAGQKEEALAKLKSMYEQGSHLDVAAIDLGLPPDTDRLTIGLELIHAIRKIEVYQELPIIAYTSQANIEYSLYANAVRRLLTLQASFLYLRPLEAGSFVTIMKYVSQGFVFLSPAPAGYLSSAVPHSPDPLPDEIWETLDALSRGLTHLMAAKELNIAADTVRSRLDRARQILIDRRQILFDARNEEIYDWFRQHQVRYVRDAGLEKSPRKVIKYYS